MPQSELEIIQIGSIGELPSGKLELFVMKDCANAFMEITLAAARYAEKHGHPARRVYQLGIQLYITGDAGND